MGALVALETARVFLARGTPVAHLFASGNRNAASYPPPADPENDADDLLMDTLVGWGHSSVSTIFGDEDEHADRQPFRTSIRPDPEIPQRQGNQAEGLASCRLIGM